MAYATSTNITDRYGANYLVDAADRDGNDVADTAAVTEALADASSEIDLYLGRRYEVPLATAPAWLVRCCVDMAVYHLASENRGSLSNEIKAKYEHCVSKLEKIAAGDLGLGLGADEPAGLFDLTLSSDTALWHPSSSEGLY